MVSLPCSKSKTDFSVEPKQNLQLIFYVHKYFLLVLRERKIVFYEQFK